MYILNDIVYAGEKTENVEITSAIPLEYRMLLLTFSNGEQRLFDTTLLTGSAFDVLNDKEVFENLKVTNGYVSWDNGEVDCSPEYMYENSYKYDTEKIVG